MGVGGTEWPGSCLWSFGYICFPLLYFLYLQGRLFCSAVGHDWSL